MANQHKTVEEVWNAIAESFDTTRRTPWDQCIQFINQISKKSIVVDLGCGNGRHLIPCAQRCEKVIGVDISRRLLVIVNKKVMEQKLGNVLLLHSDLVHIPLKNNSVDVALFIASLHNIRGTEQRVASLREVHRVLKRDGQALISVWSRWQDRFRRYFIKEWFVRRAHEFGDIEIPWKQHGLHVSRFYHLYSRDEFLRDLQTAGLRVIDFQGVNLRSKRHPDNFFVTVKKG